MMIENTEQLLNILDGSKRLCIYGAGLVATVLVRYLMANNKGDRIYCVAVSDTSTNAEQIMGIPVIGLENLSEDDIDIVVVATLEKLHKEITISLEKQHFSSVHLISIKLYAQMRQTISDYTSELLIDNKVLQNKIDTLAYRFEEQVEISVVNTNAFKEYENCHNGRDIVLLGAGPTLNDYKPISGAIHIGVNSVYKFNSVKLDYYFASDFRRTEHRHEPHVHFSSEEMKVRERLLDSRLDDLAMLKCKKFVGKYMRHNGSDIDLSESGLYRINATRYYVEWNASHIFTNITLHPVANYSSIIHEAFNFGLFTNPSRIFIVGCDADYTQGHFNEPLPNLTPEGVNNSLYALPKHQISGFIRYKEFAYKNYPDTDIFVINPVGLKGIFDEYKY